MSNIASLSNKRELSFVENIQRITTIAEEHFTQLDPFKGQSFSDDVWQHQGEKLFFKMKPKGESFNNFVSNTVKAFVISNMWRTRIRRNPLSHSRLKGLVAVGRNLQQANINSITEITSSSYSSIYNELANSTTNYGALNDLNSYIHFLTNEHALPTHIDTIKTQSIIIKNGESEEFEAIKSRMPEPELIRSIIALKHAVEGRNDNSPQSERDLLCVYTQAFQYGLGLRVGEVLRLSKDCLIEHEGKLLCRVWTEKGAEPIPRFVLGDWRELIQEVHEKIVALTADVRAYAEQLEKTGSNDYITSALSEYRITRERNVEELLDRLAVFLADQKISAINAWKLKRTINPRDSYTLDELVDILPIYSIAKATHGKIRAYVKWGLELTATPQDKNKNSYTVTGQAILNFIGKQIQLRSEYMTEQEFLSTLHDRPIHRQCGRDKEIFALTEQLSGSSATCYTFDPEAYAGKGRAPTAMSRLQAETMLTKYGLGLLDEDEISVSNLNQYFPELPFIHDASRIVARNKHLDLSGMKRIATKVSFSANPNSPVEYSVTAGYAIKIDSIRRYALSRFFEKNHAEINKLNDVEIEESISTLKDLPTDFDECMLPATTISSKSFKAEQKVSDYLFLRPMQLTSTSASVSFIPEILDFGAVYYFFKGNDRYPSAFERYDINDGGELSKTWQSHQGRHWRTTSLFRSGAAKSLVNKLMGRKDEQGKHYDHNTGSERAKIVGEAMAKKTERFIGYIPKKIAKLKKKKVNTEIISEVLDKELQTISHTPCGYCTQSLELNPCQYHLRCLIGHDGSGCKKLVIDLDDPTALPSIQGIRDETRHEIERLVKLKDETGNVSIDQHLREKIKLYDNTEIIIKLGTSLISNKTMELEFIPFNDGSQPDDCPFQCGGD
jgi:hypothetical protein